VVRRHTQRVMSGAEAYSDVPTGPPLARSQFPIGERLTYLNHALVAPLPVAAVEAMAADAEAAARQASEGWPERNEGVERVRDAAARLMGVDAADVAFVKNTTEGLAFVAGGLDWRPGDRIVLPDGEYPSNEFCWLALGDRGVEVDRIAPVGRPGELPLDAFAAALEAGRGRVRVVAVSWVQFTRGWRTDLGALADLAHEHGAFLCVDAIQGLGVVPADLAGWGVDAAVADAHKWLLGPEGIGVLSVAPALRDRLRVSEPGWASVVDQDCDHPELVLHPSARRYEGGTLNMVGVAGLGASLDLLDGAGVEAVWTWVDHLAQRAAHGATALGAEVLSARQGSGRSGIVTVAVPGVEAADAVGRLGEAGIIVRARSGGIRISPHGWNTEADIDAALTALGDL